MKGNTEPPVAEEGNEKTRQKDWTANLIQEGSLLFLLSKQIYLFICLFVYIFTPVQSHFFISKSLTLILFKIIFNLILKFYTIFKGYFPFIVTTKYWLYSLCCTIHPCSLSYT